MIFKMKEKYSAIGKACPTAFQGSLPGPLEGGWDSLWRKDLPLGEPPCFPLSHPFWFQL